MAWVASTWNGSAAVSDIWQAREGSAGAFVFQFNGTTYLTGDTLGNWTATTSLIAPTITATGAGFVGSGAGLTAATVPNAALVTPPLTSLTAGSNIVVGTGTTPSVAVTAAPSFSNITNTGSTANTCSRHGTGGLEGSAAKDCYAYGRWLVTTVAQTSSGNSFASAPVLGGYLEAVPPPGAYVDNVEILCAIQGSANSNTISLYYNTIQSTTGATLVGTVGTYSHTGNLLQVFSLTPTVVPSGNLIFLYWTAATNAAPQCYFYYGGTYFGS